jgi:hypothetical protein
MPYRLRTLLIPRRLARLQFTFYEVVGLLTVAAISLAIGTSFLHDSLAVSLGIIGASLFNGILCYLVGNGIGRFSGRRLDGNDRPISRFTIRDMLWLTAVVAVLVAWRVGHNNWERDGAILRQIRSEFTPISHKLQSLEQSRAWRAESLTHLSSKLHSRPPMTDEQVKEIDEHLAQRNWIYNPEAEQFEIAPSDFPRIGAVTIDWEEVVIDMPDLSLNEIMAYKERKRREWLQQQGKERSR